MLLPSGHRLAYCLNAFDVTSIDDLEWALKHLTQALRAQFDLSHDTAIDMGFWFAHHVMPKEIRAFTQLLKKYNVEMTTLNAFPYGKFHGDAIKRKVYLPHWGDKARLDYTLACAQLLHEVSGTGVISTLPIGYHDILNTDAIPMAQNHILELAEQLPKGIRIAFEPEPDCVCETTDQMRNFLASVSNNSQLGVCLDTSHCDVVGEMPDLSRNDLFKIQLSVGKEFHPALIDTPLFETLQDPIYLHQTRTSQSRWEDLPSKASIRALPAETVLRTHYHQGVYLDESQTGIFPLNLTFKRVLNTLKSQKNEINLQTLLEVETYSWHINGKVISNEEKIACIVKEYASIFQQLGSPL